MSSALSAIGLVTVSADPLGHRVGQAKPPGRYDVGNAWIDNKIATAPSAVLLNCLRGMFAAIEHDPGNAIDYCQRGRKLVDLLRGRMLSLPPEAPPREEGIRMK